MTKEKKETEVQGTETKTREQQVSLTIGNLKELEQNKVIMNELIKHMESGLFKNTTGRTLFEISKATARQLELDLKKIEKELKMNKIKNE